jgi:MFS family permease
MTKKQKEISAGEMIGGGIMLIFLSFILSGAIGGLIAGLLVDDSRAVSMSGVYDYERALNESSAFWGDILLIGGIIAGTIGIVAGISISSAQNANPAAKPKPKPKAKPKLKPMPKTNKTK